MYLMRFLLLLLLSVMTAVAVFRPGVALRTAANANKSRSEVRVTTVQPVAGPDRVSQLSDFRLTTVTQNRRSDLFPDVPLTDQYGNVHRFRSDIVRDNIVCVVFFYTECQGSCPGTTQMMKRLRESLKDDFANEPLKFVSISLDPENDTPADLLAYADNNRISAEADLPEWIFCTGTLDDVESVRVALGLYDLDPVVDADRTEHAALITFGNDQYNRWTAMPAGLKFSDLSETFRRITGTTERQRFETRIRTGGARADAHESSAGNSCCTNPSQKNNKPCCCRTADDNEPHDSVDQLRTVPMSVKAGGIRQSP